MRIAGLLATAFALTAGPVLAQTTPEAPQAPAAAESPICTDRPTKANVPCTVPAGDFQIEADWANWSHSSEAGVTTDMVLAPNPTFKYGVTSNLDVEVNLAPWAQVQTSAGGRTLTDSSVGDLFIRTKWAAISGSVFSLSVIPYVKLPTANHVVGNGAPEGGVIAPMSIALPAKFTLVLGPELDALANADRDGTHLNVVNLLNLSRSVGRFTVYAELWNDQNFDPTRGAPQTTADTAVTYLLNPSLQLDAGANFGLDRAAARHQLYLGVSHRF